VQSIVTQADRSIHVLALSAHTERALLDAATRLQQYLLGRPEIALGDFCAAVNARPDPAPNRVALFARSHAQMHEQLDALLRGDRAKERLTGHVSETQPPRIAFMLTGQGSQYVSMARQLYTTLPVFKGALDRCAEILSAHLAEPLLSAIFPEPDQPTPLNETAYTQPVLFALEYSLAQVWHSWGISPAVLIGHSVGEYTAACLADVFGLEEGLRLIALRGRLMQELQANGSMAVVFADEERVRAAIEPYWETVSVAAINGRTNIVISGLKQAVSTLIAGFEAQQIQTFPLAVSHAFHSPLMEPMLESFERAASQTRYQKPRVPIVSNVTGRLLAAGQIPDSAYWRRHVRACVRFADGIQSLCDQGYRVFLEVGPGAALVGMGKRCVSGKEVTWLPSIENGSDDLQIMLRSVGALYVGGATVDWRGVHGGMSSGDPRHRVELAAELSGSMRG